MQSESYTMQSVILQTTLKYSYLLAEKCCIKIELFLLYYALLVSASRFISSILLSFFSCNAVCHGGTTFACMLCPQMKVLRCNSVSDVSWLNQGHSCFTVAVTLCQNMHLKQVWINTKNFEVFLERHILNVTT